VHDANIDREVRSRATVVRMLKICFNFCSKFFNFLLFYDNFQNFTPNFHYFLSF
jgi:hypothetical protein